MRAALFLIAVALAAPAAHAAQVCGWIEEAKDDDNAHTLTLWFEADADVDLAYRISGGGISDATGRAQSPGNGNLYLSAGAAETPWALGSSIYPPTQIEVIASIDAGPRGEGTLPAKAQFTFQRTITDAEGAPPATLAKRQCLTVPIP